MAVTYRFESNVLVIESGARFTTEDLGEMVRAGLVDPACPAKPCLVLDIRESRESASAAEIRDRVYRFVEARDHFGPRMAIVVSDSLHYGLSRMALVYLDAAGVQARVLRSVDEAIAWAQG